jgi:ribosomal protein S12 methylthiotransferase accessory factor
VPSERARIASRKARPVSRGGSPKALLRGTHRAAALAQTLAKIKPLMGPLGITRVANVTGLDCIGIPVVMVCRPNARSLAVSQGKGLDLDAARVSGLMESIELYHAERIRQPLWLGSYNELRHAVRLALVDALPRVSVSQFHADLQLLWISGSDAVDGEPTFVPYELVHTNYTLPLPTGSGSFVLSSNGLASGNHLLEAVSHGLCEVIERDATTLFRCLDDAAQARARVDLETIRDPDCRQLLTLFERADIAVGVWDVTSDIGIATYQCVVLDRDPNPFRRLGPLEGMGCHPVREVALERALTEAAQGRLTLIAGSRDDYGRERHQDAQHGERLEKARKWLAEPGSANFSDTPSYQHETFEEDVQVILAKLTALKIEHPIIVDLTRPEFDVAVVRVVVPGLETYHDVPGYVPGSRALRVLGARAEAAGRANSS